MTWWGALRARLMCRHERRTLLSIRRDWQTWARVGQWRCETCGRKWEAPGDF